MVGSSDHPTGPIIDRPHSELSRRTVFGTEEPVTDVPHRRPLKTRSAGWALPAAQGLARMGFSPNGVSVLGVGFALGGGVALAQSATGSTGLRIALLAVGAVAIQLRLLCNMLDGMIAVECGRKSKVGDLFNEIPDRIEDTVLLLGMGLAAATPLGLTLGWTASALALLTAYLRALGGSLGLAQDFCGPGAKPHRMFVLTVTAIAGAIEAGSTGGRQTIVVGLALIVALTAITAVRRTVRLGRALQAR